MTSSDRPAGRSPRPPLHDVGEPPDYRFTLANERTFLAWVRTSLALMAAGVAVVQFVPGLPVIRHALGFVLIALGGVLAAVSYAHWERNERAMRLGERLPHSPIPRVVAAVLALSALAALVLTIVDLVRS
ncbi:MAG: YidH family protein [Nocardioidaceae bacterium]